MIRSRRAELPDAQPAIQGDGRLQGRPRRHVVGVGGGAATADPAVAAIVGSDRYVTSVMVASRFFVTPQLVAFASGENFPDALPPGRSWAEMVSRCSSCRPAARCRS
jgi:hypothetical protein